jgi:hypothetical protein
MNRKLWLGLAVAPFASPVHAQSAALPTVAVPANTSVADRARPGYEPIGGRIGSFFLYPTIDVTTQYNSNIRATEDNTVSDVVFDLRPALRLTSIFSRNQLDANVYYDKNFHVNQGREDYAQYGANVGGRYDLGSNMSVGGTVSADRLAVPRTDINSNAASRSPITYTNLSASGTVRRDFVRLAVVASGNVNHQSFNDAETVDGIPLPQGFRDNLSYSGALEGRFSVASRTRLIARGEAGAIQYDDNPLSGFDRNSHYYRIEGGVGFDATALLSGDLRVGYFHQSNDDPRFLDSSGLSFSANLLYNPTALTSVRLTGDRSVEPGGSTVTSGNVRSTVRVGVDHELLPNVVVSGAARYSHIDVQGPLSGANEYDGQLSGVYYVNRRFRLRASVGYFGRSSRSFGSYNVATGSLGLSVTL